MEQKEEDARGGQESPTDSTLINDASEGSPAPPPDGGGADVRSDPLRPVSEWPFVEATFDFFADGQYTFGVRLTPRPAPFEGLDSERRAATLKTYRAIHEQLNGPGVTFYAETNLALNSGGTLARTALNERQCAEVLKMVAAVVAYLEADGPDATFEVQGVALPLTLNPEGHEEPLPPLFEIVVRLGIRRDPSILSRPLDGGEQLGPAEAEEVSSVVAPAFHAAADDGKGASAPEKFAADFERTFGELRLAVSDGDGGDGSKGFGRRPLWAVRKALLEISIGASGQDKGPLFMAPRPLDRALRTATVPMPSLPEWVKEPPPPQMLFSSVDLDEFNRAFFEAVDDILAPESAARVFEQANDAYTTIARGRESLAKKYSRHGVGWMFGPESPFTGTPEQLAAGRAAFERQVRASLSAAYSFSTVVQFPVVWRKPVQEVADGTVVLTGQVRPAAERPALDDSRLSTGRVNVGAAGERGLLTFLYGPPDDLDVSEVALDLTFDVTHVEYNPEPEGEATEDSAPKVVRLKLLAPCPDSPSHIGPAGSTTTVPLISRRYPPPPTIIDVKGEAGAGSRTRDADPSDPFGGALEWHLAYSYEFPSTAHDELLSTVAYNTDSRDSADEDGQRLTTVGDGRGHSLFASLARFKAVHLSLLPALSEPESPNWAAAVRVFADRVEDVANSDWDTPTEPATAASPGNVENHYTTTDVTVEAVRTVTMAWEPGQKNVSAALSILLLSPDGDPDSDPPPQQKEEANSVTATYTPPPRDLGRHRVEAGSLNVLSAENALVSMRVRRNLFELTDPDGKRWSVNDEFVYETPSFRARRPASPLIESDVPIDVALLPNLGRGVACAPPAGGLCRRVFVMLENLLARPLLAAGSGAFDGAGARRRLDLSCQLRYRVGQPDGSQPGEVPAYAVLPLIHALPVEASVADPPRTEELNRHATLISQAIRDLCVSRGIAFGPAATHEDTCLVFDITLHALLGEPNTPVLKLSRLELKLTDIDTL
ncbi:MAG: hypothetical protein JOZ02_00345 [Acidobacteria bacterium]|nr:hypothetical protein [Acidobacteriota bacterium]